MKNKLNLNQLKVKSFVTDFEKDKENTIKGGMPPKSEKSMIVNNLSWACCEMTIPC